MPSKELKLIFLLSLPLIYLHALEEVLGGFSHIDSFMQSGASLFNTTPELFYWVSHVLYWLALPTLFVLFKGSRLGMYLLVLFGFSYIFELHHLIKALIAESYYPGMITASIYILFGIFFWTRLLKNLKIINP